MKTFISRTALLPILALLTGCEGEEYFKRLTLQDDGDGGGTQQIVDAVDRATVAIENNTLETGQEGDQTQALLTSTQIPVAQDEGVTSDPHSPSLADNPTHGSGFVWKPISEGDGNLVILIPSYSSTTSVGIEYSGGSEQGNYVGRTNGDRPTFRFSAPGTAYGQNITVSSETGETYDIGDGGTRVD